MAGRKPTGRVRKNITLTLTDEERTKLSELASQQGMSISELIGLLSNLLRQVPDNLPLPQKLLLYLNRKVAEGDTEAQEYADYLESWMNELTVAEMLAEGVIRVGSSYII